MVASVTPTHDLGPLSARHYESGETIPVRPIRRRRVNVPEGVAYIMLDMLVAVRAPVMLTRTEQVVMNIMLGEYRLGEAYCRLNQTEIAALAQMKRQNVAAAMKRLLRDRWIFKVSSNCWYVSPHYGFRGSRSDWYALRRQTDPPVVHDAEGEAWLAQIAEMEFDAETGEVR